MTEFLKTRGKAASDVSRGVAGLNLGVLTRLKLALEPAVSLLGVKRKQSPTQISTTALATTARSGNN